DRARARAPLPCGEAAWHQHGLGPRPRGRHHAARGAPLRRRRRALRRHRAAARALAPRRLRRARPRPRPAPPARPHGRRRGRRRPRPVIADVVIDTRPLWRIIVGRTYRPVVLAIGLVAFIALRAMPPVAGLSPAGQSALAVFALCLVYWVTNVIP